MSPAARKFPSGLNRTAFTEVVCLNACTNVTSRTCSISLLYMADHWGFTTIELHEVFADPSTDLARGGEASIISEGDGTFGE